MERMETVNALRSMVLDQEDVERLIRTAARFEKLERHPHELTEKMCQFVTDSGRPCGRSAGVPRYPWHYDGLPVFCWQHEEIVKDYVVHRVLVDRAISLQIESERLNSTEAGVEA